MRRPRLFLLLGVPTLTGCDGPESMFRGAGPAARTIESMWWVMFALGAAVYLVVMALALLAVRRSRRRRAEGPEDEGRADTISRRLVVFGGIVGPAVVLVALQAVMVPMGQRVADRGAQAEGEVIEVVAEMFWWRVTYPDRDIVTANEIHIPTGEPVRVRLTSTDVIHSFWIPQLGGKIDATPGHTTQAVLETDEPGRYRGRCTEYCGLAHAQMQVVVVAQEPAEFERWAAAQAEPQPPPEDERLQQGREVFLGSSCVYCHTIDGHSPPNTIGPDLTHLASRETIGAGILENNRANLGGWIVDPQAQKPGNPMPGTQIAGDELEALLDYLESLE